MPADAHDVTPDWAGILARSLVASSMSPEAEAGVQLRRLLRDLQRVPGGAGPARRGVIRG
jgi:hypothetical protein